MNLTEEQLDEAVEARKTMKKGDMVAVDLNYHNWSEVEIISLTPFNPDKYTVRFATIRAKDGYAWQTMCNRLFPLPTIILQA